MYVLQACQSVHILGCICAALHKHELVLHYWWDPGSAVWIAKKVSGQTECWLWLIICPCLAPRFFSEGVRCVIFRTPGASAVALCLKRTHDEWLPHRESVLGQSDRWWIAFTSCHLLWPLLSKSTRGHLHDLFVMRLQFLWCQQSRCRFDVIAAILAVDADWGQKGLADCGVQETTDWFWLGDFACHVLIEWWVSVSNCARHPEPCSLSLMFKPPFISLMTRHLSLLFKVFMRVGADRGGGWTEKMQRAKAALLSAWWTAVRMCADTPGKSKTSILWQCWIWRWALIKSTPLW